MNWITKYRKIGSFILFSMIFLNIFSQENKSYWNNKLKITSFRLPPPPVGYKPKLVDLNGDGKPDAIFSITRDSIPILWIDDDGDMTWDDLEGDMKNDCLLIDRNRDGIYGGPGDLIIDWVDTDNDGKADMQIVVEYPNERTGEVWPNGHYMIVMDLDHDNIFNFIDWNTMQLKSWEKSGICDFYPDYSGQTAFMKIHTSTYDIKDLRLNWENPFLFYDEDGDGLTEMAIRLVDSPKIKDKNAPSNSYVNRQLEGVIDWVSISVDMDNDNAPGNEFDFDFTIGFQGEGFNYMDQVHKFNNLRGLPAADTFFMDPRWRQMTELIYPDHQSAWDLIFNRGKWNRVNFVWDEDDDNNRWERVEFYDPLDPFKIGWKNGGIDNNKQSDIAGDRGEWDMDNSGKGKLYISKFDGRLHLYGAEWGCWRIDQNTEYYEGWDRVWLNRTPKNYATIKYTDKDNNGFLDYIEYDMDGDSQFETIIDLKALGIDDRCELIDISSFKYKDFTNLMQKMSDDIWENAQTAVKVAEKYHSPTGWYAKLKQASSIREKYHKGYWLQYYLYKDLEYLFLRKQDKKALERLNKAYFSGNWESLLINENQVSGLVSVAKGWSNNSINAVIFRKNAIVTHKDIQFISYYDTEGFVTLGKRKLGSSEWTIQRTPYKGNVNDAHNCISIMADGNGYLHVSWDHHAQALNYAKSKEPFSLELGEKQSMTGSLETKVTYPEFYKMPDGNLLFFYRDGQSGRGNLLLNHYDYKTQTWTQLHKNLIDGENQRNAYWQACVDKKGTIHLSWVWRETSSVETNHDICYARSRDGGKTWENSKGEKYTLPVSASTAEYACKIPQSSELANQTAMTADKDGKPYIANYWRTSDSDAPQYHVVYHDGKKWVDLNMNFRNLSFTLRGAGTKRLPISRPQIIANDKQISLIFRDEERENKVSIATCKDIKKNLWQVSDLTDFTVGMWEPTFDTELWRDKDLLHIFVQNVDQIDNEGKSDIPPQMVQVLELKSNK